ncbi:hypothetical protein N7468_004266 [Penicillium chermesinum]|uniref:Uncharacterized protein n=1 Tax=Penicillium chermesinum TaxID=63820 RepID=A0A9W9TSL1_9EURO|nr:uncharacterized protein N7468_004266 [Penicillium chermesinum]KAJ5239647.1 hypothetical protein N7468_004266 [Penicillium chermesinum]KAJ6166535.1 hypothetical protein N7470_001982 [Penicillium chermesinum]
MNLNDSIFLSLGLLLAVLSSLANANVEKTIFLGPKASTVPPGLGHSGLDDLGLERLSPERPVIRTKLNASFPTTEAPDGSESWYFLENLMPGQRYEVRVCWLATQPTAFTLTTHDLSTTVDDTDLLSSLSVFSAARLASNDADLQENAGLRPAPGHHASDLLDPAPRTKSVLFLRVRAAADYFTTNKTLMENVPPVAVDLVLDPFLLNVFPRSLVPTAGWLVVVAGVGYVVARWVAAEIGRVIDDARRIRDLEEKEKKKEK